MAQTQSQYNILVQVLEKLKSMDSKMDNMDDKINNMDDKINNMDDKITTLNENFESYKIDTNNAINGLRDNILDMSRAIQDNTTTINSDYALLQDILSKLNDISKTLTNHGISLKATGYKLMELDKDIQLVNGMVYQLNNVTYNMKKENQYELKILKEEMILVSKFLNILKDSETSQQSKENEKELQGDMDKIKIMYNDYIKRKQDNFNNDMHNLRIVKEATVQIMSEDSQKTHGIKSNGLVTKQTNENKIDG